MCRHCAPRAITWRVKATGCAYNWRSITPISTRWQHQNKCTARNKYKDYIGNGTHKDGTRVATCFELHQTMQVYIFRWMSNLSITRLPCQGVTYRICLVFFSGLASAPFTSFLPSPVPARSCPALSYSAMFHSQVLLRRLHRNLPMSVPASVCMHVSFCVHADHAE